jgi:hypothetical protein
MAQAASDSAIPKKTLPTTRIIVTASADPSVIA